MRRAEHLDAVGYRNPVQDTGQNMVNKSITRIRQAGLHGPGRDIAEDQRVVAAGHAFPQSGQQIRATETRPNQVERDAQCVVAKLGREPLGRLRNRAQADPIGRQFSRTGLGRIQQSQSVVRAPSSAETAPRG